MKHVLLIILSFVVSTAVLLISCGVVAAAEDPRSQPANNRFGIHIIDPIDLDDAAALVNSNGGDWGYVTLVIRDNQRDTGYWNDVFAKMADLHLVPIVRIATHQRDGNWVVPPQSEYDTWISFLQSLQWPTRNRYIIVGNEPNHAKEWGGRIAPEEYAQYFASFSQRLKASSTDYFILPAGMDADAPEAIQTLSAERYIERMIQEVPDIFSYADGWNSHSYPNPAFSGDVSDTGRATVRSYEWELELLKSLGIEKDFPVFITETGWIMSAPLSPEEAGNRLKTAYETAWSDPRVVAVTPFLLSHPYPPFDQFSWKGSDGTYLPIYSIIQEMTKVAGTPRLPEPKVLGDSTSRYDFSHQMCFDKNTATLMQNYGLFGTMSLAFGK